MRNKLHYFLLLAAVFVMAACTSNKSDQPAAVFVLQESQLPDYEKNIDHKGLILASINDEEKSLERGRRIYGAVCFNCHRDRDQNGSIPTAFKFWEGQFKVGKDPYAMYQTLTRGYGSMPP